MISFAEFEIALRGLARLVRFDAGFAGFFDLSRDGARRSFRLALPILPVYLVLLHLNTRYPDGTDMVRVYLSEVIGYAILWAAFPLLLLSAARLIDRGPRIYGAIAVYNWLSVLSVALQLPITLAAYFGLSAGWNDGLGWVAEIFVLACEFFAFKRLLDIAFEAALALTILDFVIGQMIYMAQAYMAQGPLF
jgi:hypothetical protein